MDRYAPANERMGYRHLRPNATIIAEQYAGANHAPCTNPASWPDLRPGANHHQRPNFRRWVDSRTHIQHGAGMHARVQWCRRMKHRRNPRPSQIRLRCNNRGRVSRHPWRHIRVNNHRAGAGCLQRGGIAAVVQKTHLIAVCHLQRRDTVQQALAITLAGNIPSRRA
jgi:hypothetical protein